MRWALVVVPVGLMGWTLSASAQDAPAEEVELSDADVEARDAYDAGAVAFDEGRYEVALELFERSHALSQRPELLYNIGLCLDRLRRDEAALDAFERYLAAAPDTPHRRQVNARITSLRAALEREGASGSTGEEGSVDLTGGGEAEEQDDDGSILGDWWFWTIVGVVVLGGAAATIAIIATSGEEVEDPLPGTQGAVFSTLRFGP